MKSALLAWELGGGLGHLGNLLPLTTALQGRGFNATVISQDVVTGRAFAELHGVRLLQAPFVRLPISFAPASFPEMLLCTQFATPNALLACVQSWLGYFDLAKPDVVIAESAPTALLAAYISGIPCVTLGHGFSVPPIGDPIPPFRIWEPIPTERVASSERQILDTVNRVLVTYDRSKLARLSDLLASAKSLLVTWRLLDHYRRGDSAQYHGPILVEDKGDKFMWPTAERPRAFVYLKPETPDIDQILSTLTTAGFVCAVYGVSSQLLHSKTDEHSRRRIHLLDRPVNLAQMFCDVDLLVSNGGHSLLCSAIRSGIPALVIPLNAEQLIIGKKIEAQQFGRCRIPGFDKQPVHEVLGSMKIERRKVDQQRLPVAQLDSLAGYVGELATL